MRDKFGNNNRQEPLTCRAGNVVENERVSSLNTRNRYIGSDNVQHIVDTRNVIARTKPDFLSWLRSVAAEAS